MVFFKPCTVVHVQIIPGHWPDKTVSSLVSSLFLAFNCIPVYLYVYYDLSDGQIKYYYTTILLCFPSGRCGKWDSVHW